MGHFSFLAFSSSPLYMAQNPLTVLSMTRRLFNPNFFCSSSRAIDGNILSNREIFLTWPFSVRLFFSLFEFETDETAEAYLLLTCVCLESCYHDFVTLFAGRYRNYNSVIMWSLSIDIFEIFVYVILCNSNYFIKFRKLFEDTTSMFLIFQREKRIQFQ